MSKYVFCYVTTKNKLEAKRIAKQLVQKKLVGCANIIPEVSSTFKYKKKLFEVKEAILIAKTTKSKAREVTKFIKKIHSYELPCIVFLPIEYGEKNFLNWIGKEVKK
jgi:periplasmic divalent cation tolerance protein